MFSSAPEDLDQGEHLRSLLEDLQNVRQDKIRNGLAKIAGDVQSGGTAFVIQMNNISALEINSVREFMLGVRATVDGVASSHRNIVQVLIYLTAVLCSPWINSTVSHNSLQEQVRAVVAMFRLSGSA